MKVLLFIITLFITVNLKAQDLKYNLVEVNNEYVVKSDFHAVITTDKVVVDNNTYYIHSEKEGVYLLMKNGVVFEMTVNDNELAIVDLNKEVSLIYYKD
jgi:hypothetical protein